MIVLDCSAAVPMALGTPEGMSLRSLMLRNERVVSSALLCPELCSALRKYVKAGLLSAADAAERIDAVLDMVDVFMGFEDSVQEVLAESLRLDHSPYDVFYLVLARRLGATLFTEDRRLVHLCESCGVDCIHRVEELA